VPEIDNEAVREAHERLQEAIADVCRASGMADGMITTSWVVVGHQAGYQEGSRLSGYFQLTGEEQPEHVTLGLLHRAVINMGEEIIS
jgi:hypothetical protein